MLRFQKAWKLYFLLSLALFVYGLFLGIKGTWEEKEPPTLVALLSNAIDAVALVSLYGLAWQVRLGFRGLWVASFFLSLGLFIYYSGDVLTAFRPIDWSNAFTVRFLFMTLLLSLPMLVANFLYAFRSDYLWSKTS